MIPIEGYWCKLFQTPPRILLRVEREGRLMFGEGVSIRVLRILLLEVSGIRQQESAQVCGRIRAKSRPVESVLCEQRQISGVVEVS